WRLGVAGALDHDPYPTMVKPAAQFLIREGPLTQLDRWEDLGGLSPSTLATCVAALLVAAEFAHEAGEHVAAGHFRAVADYWNDRVETWCSTTTGQYVRLSGDPDHRPTVGAIAPEFLELVRYGIRRPKDERILRSLQGVDATLKVSLPAGPGWRRYTGDLYGEKDDGAPWDGSGRGRASPGPAVGRPARGGGRAISSRGACRQPKLFERWKGLRDRGSCCPSRSGTQ